MPDSITNNIPSETSSGSPPDPDAIADKYGDLPEKEQARIARNIEKATERAKHEEERTARREAAEEARAKRLGERHNLR